jgi:transcriptional regulator with GAF, ATPase, and Fis domain
MQANPIPKNLQELQQKVAFTENVKRITDQILAASDLDHILLDMRNDILSIFDAEAVTIYAFDSEKKEIFSKVPHIDSVEEFRIPITEQSLAGFCAKYLRPVSIADAYNAAELQSIHPSLLHDNSYDKRTGFKTKQVLTYPIVADNKYLMGVFQLLNKKAAHDSQERMKNPSRKSRKHSALLFSISKRLQKRIQPNSTCWLQATALPRTSWIRRLSNPRKACRTSRVS